MFQDISWSGANTVLAPSPRTQAEGRKRKLTCAAIRHSGLLLDLSVKISINQERVATLDIDLLAPTKPLRRP